MSGLEVVGVVLGAFPIALAALDGYREVATRLGVFHKIRLEHKRWREDLEFHQLAFSRNLRQLLLPLGIDDQKVQELISSPGGQAWHEPQIAELLKLRLRSSLGLYISYVEQIRQIMADVNAELALGSDMVQERLSSEKTSTTKTRLKSVLNIRGFAFQLFKIKFSNSEASRRKLFARLADYNHKLEKLLDSGDKDSALERKRLEGTRPPEREAEEQLCTFWTQAGRLFQALSSAWECDCQGHRAHLLLEDRTSGQQGFQVTFTDFKTSHWEVLNIRILEQEKKNGQLSSAHNKADKAALTTSGTASQVPRQDHLIPGTSQVNLTPSKTAAQPNCQAENKLASEQMPLQHVISERISNLCTSMDWTGKSDCGFLTEEDRRYNLYALSRRNTQTPLSVTLDHILRGGAFSKPTRTQRHTIALVLASSVLQLLGSPWLPVSFSKQDIHFLDDEDNMQALPLSQPHVVFHAGRSKTQIRHDQRRICEALDYLGILLLELCFGALLENQEHRRSWPSGSSDRERAVFDLMAARDWQRDVVGEAGSDYAEAVGWCLGGNRSTLPERWRHEMLRNVVKPLKRCCDYIAGATSVPA